MSSSMPAHQIAKQSWTTKSTDRDLILSEFKNLKGADRDRIAKLIGYDRTKTFGELDSKTKRERAEFQRNKLNARYQADTRNPLGAGTTQVAGGGRYNSGTTGQMVANESRTSAEFIADATDKEEQSFRDMLKDSQREARDEAINKQLRDRALFQGGDVSDISSLDGATELDQKKRLARLNRKTLLGQLIGGGANEGKTLIGQ